jgi:hypothetical protein
MSTAPSVIKAEFGQSAGRRRFVYPHGLHADRKSQEKRLGRRMLRPENRADRLTGKAPMARAAFPNGFTQTISDPANGPETSGIRFASMEAGALPNFDSNRSVCRKPSAVMCQWRICWAVSGSSQPRRAKHWSTRRRGAWCWPTNPSIGTWTSSQRCFQCTLSCWQRRSRELSGHRFMMDAVRSRRGGDRPGQPGG